MRASFENRPEVRQVRVLAQDAGAAGTDFPGVVEARGPLPGHTDPAPFGAAADALDLVGTRTPF